MNTKSMLLAGGLAGVVMGLIASLPFVGIISSCCCLWAGLWGCGVLAVWIYRLSEKTQPRLTIGQGVLLGLIAGAVGAVIGSILGALFNMVSAGVETASIMSYMDQVPGMSDSLDPSQRQIINQIMSTSGNILFNTICNFIRYPLFGMAGGLIGAGLIWKK
ncbi:MAG: hypothetical protein ACK2UB_11515 [Anaerolineales bacterium]